MPIVNLIVKRFQESDLTPFNSWAVEKLSPQTPLAIHALKHAWVTIPPPPPPPPLEMS